MRILKLNTTANVMVFMTSSSDHISPSLGSTLTISLSKDGGAFSSISPIVTERGTGWYSLALSSSDIDTLGDLAIHITAPGADDTDLVMWVDDYGSSALAVQNILTDEFAAIPSSTATASEVWQTVIESGLSAEQLLRIMGAAIDGKSTGVGTTSEQYLSIDGMTTRINVTFDSNNNRIVINLNGT